jgi:transcriptional regulator with XRE-family HTH domain
MFTFQSAEISHLERVYPPRVFCKEKNILVACFFMEAENRIKIIFSEIKPDGYSQVKFAEAIGKTQQTVSRYLSGEILPNESVALLIESKFGYRKEWILNGDLPKKLDESILKAEIKSTQKLIQDINSVPEIRDLLPKIRKLKSDDYNALLAIIRKFVG